MYHPENYMFANHIPDMIVADDGFGNLIETPDSAFWFNRAERFHDFGM